MAVLQKIRQRSLLLIVVIGFCLLAFIVGDIVNSGGFKSSSKDVGSINGKDVPFEEFRVKVSNVEKSQQGMTPTAAANTVWNQEVSVALLTAEFEKLGLRVGSKHIMEVFKADPNIGQNATFLNAKGEFDEAKFKEFFKSNPEQAESLKAREKDAELNAKYQIYNTLVKGGIYTTESEGKLKYEMESNKVNFGYVAGLYSSIKDTQVKIEDSEITEFMKKDEKKYKADETREIQYVLIEEKASVADENEIKNNVNKLLSGSIVYNQATGKNDTLSGFKNATNIAEFVNSNSDVAYDSTYVAKKDLPTEVAEQLYNLAPGAIFGPYMAGKNYCISKSLGRKVGVNARASHILISYEGTQVPNKKEVRTKEQAKAKAESILAQVLANPGSFFMSAYTASDDSSSQQGGDLGFFGPNQMVKPFNDFVFNNPVGKIGLVETDFGFHVIQIAEKQDGIRLATIAQKIEPSETTSNKIFEQATKFEMDAATKDFEKLAKEMKLTVPAVITSKLMDESVGALGNQRNIVRWAFDKETNVGDIERFEIPNLGHVIAKVKKVNEEGLMTVELARPSVEPILRNKKKAELLKAKMTASSLEAIAKANATTVQQAVGVTMDNPSISTGQEPKVVGTAFSSQPNKLSAPIEGISGVYVVKSASVVKAPAIKDYTPYIAKLKTQSAGDSNRVIPALKVDAKIVDNRSQFNY